MFNYDELKMKNGVFYDIKKMKVEIPEIISLTHKQNSILDKLEYHNGYIFMNSKKQYPGLVKAFNDHVNKTFDKVIELNGQEYRVIGFDTAHSLNFMYPESQSFNAVEDMLYKILEAWTDELHKQ